jgi:hypothetical protein
MAINSLIDHIANHGTDGGVIVGANTPAPYAGANLTGFVDGTGPQNASKNMAEFYNRQVFAYKHLVEAAGLAWDKDNWAQMTQAIRLISTPGFGGLCPNVGPFFAPTETNPATKYKSALGEYWEWMGDAWKVTAGKYGQRFVSLAYSMAAGVEQVAQTFVCHRAGKLVADVAVYGSTGSAGQAVLARVMQGGVNFLASDLSPTTTASEARFAATASCSIDVLPGYVLTSQVTANLAQVGIVISTFFYED